jgi:hypothetical protein
MATKTTTTLVDDLDGTELPEGTRPTSFGINGSTYEIDLSGANAEKLAAALDPFIEKARSVRTARPSARMSSTRAGASANRDRLARIREWAEANKKPVASRGRIAESIVAEYEAATGDRG